MYCYICPWCINEDRECCSECAAEGQFMYLEPETLWDWEHFELPPLLGIIGNEWPCEAGCIMAGTILSTARGNEGHLGFPHAGNKRRSGKDED